MIYILHYNDRLKLKHQINLKHQKFFVYLATPVTEQLEELFGLQSERDDYVKSQDCFSERKLQSGFAIVMCDFYSASFRSD